MKGGISRFQSELQSRPKWSIEAAQTLATSLMDRLDQAAARRELIYTLLRSHGEVRKRAADVARRITDRGREWLNPSAAQFLSILADVPLNESRTRWHLGLVVARTARTQSEILTAAELLWKLSEDKSNVVRCSAVEGLGELSTRSTIVREEVEPYLLASFRAGTPAMRCRARAALKRLGICIGR